MYRPTKNNKAPKVEPWGTIDTIDTIFSYFTSCHAVGRGCLREKFLANLAPFVKSIARSELASAVSSQS